MTRREELVRVDGRRDAAAHRALVRSPEARGIGLVDEHRLHEHRQVLVARRVAIRLSDDAGNGAGDPADEKAVTFVFCQTARSSRRTTAIFVSNCMSGGVTQPTERERVRLQSHRTEA